MDLETFGTEAIDRNELADLVEGCFDFRPAAILKQLDLRRPIYAATSAYGHFGRPDFPWESTDAADGLAKAAEGLS